MRAIPTTLTSGGANTTPVTRTLVEPFPSVRLWKFSDYYGSKHPTYLYLETRFSGCCYKGSQHRPWCLCGCKKLRQKRCSAVTDLTKQQENSLAAIFEVRGDAVIRMGIKNNNLGFTPEMT
jgi:hypothetical protein